MDVVPTREGYDRWASIYDDEDNPLIALEEPQVDQLLGAMDGLEVADIGCGTGRHSIRLAARGARVTGLDFSQEMLAQARRKAGAAVQLLQHDLAQPLPLPSASFDRVVCGLVLEHIDDLQLLFREMKRICRLDGAIVVSAMHPSMMLRGISARFTDPSTGRETRPRSLGHQICDFVMAAKGADLLLDHLGEHLADEALAKRCPRAAKYLGWPMLLMMRFTPVAAS
jgi:malonyl-CoA O-methyltransferase